MQTSPSNPPIRPALRVGAAIALLFGACVDDTQLDVGDASGTSETGDETCERIELPGDTYYPENIARGADGLLYISSAGTGAILRVDPCRGAEPLVAAQTDLRNATGVAVDDARGLLLVCDSDASPMGEPSIDVFDLHDGELLASHAFDGPAFCNDLTLDDMGHVYATDSFGARIVRVSAAELDTDSPVETWATDPAFAVDMGQFGLNGISFDGARNLYVVNFTLGDLHRVHIGEDGQAQTITPIELPAPLAMPDGLRALDSDTLLVVEVGANALSTITLEGDSGTLALVADGFDTPTGVALAGDHAWVVEGQIDHLIGADPNPPALPFLALRVEL